MSPLDKSSSPVAFLLDENVDVRLAKYLKQLGYQTTLISKQTPDKEVIKTASSQKVILLTHGHDFTNTNLYQPTNEFGILHLQVHPTNFKNSKKVLDQLFASLNTASLYGKIITATIDGMEIITP